MAQEARDGGLLQGNQTEEKRLTTLLILWGCLDRTPTQLPVFIRDLPPFFNFTGFY
jgi:hypothetical protein